MDQRLEKARVEPNQVQVVWMKQAEISPAQYGAFPAHAQVLRDNMGLILRMLKTRFPNLRVAYLSSRIYAGYATTPLNPEPYAYESAFSVRWLIEAQINNDPNLNYGHQGGGGALLLWGVPVGRRHDTASKRPYGLAREDLAMTVTSSTSGRQKMAQMLLDFQDQTQRRQWFLRSAATDRTVSHDKDRRVPRKTFPATS
jgi:hypothetical protein